MKDKRILEFLSIKCKTWTRDSHGLFDYESQTVRENNLQIFNDAQLIRKNHEIREKSSNENSEGDEQHVSNVRTDKGNFLIFI